MSKPLSTHRLKQVLPRDPLSGRQLRITCCNRRQPTNDHLTTNGRAVDCQYCRKKQREAVGLPKQLPAETSAAPAVFSKSLRDAHPIF